MTIKNWKQYFPYAAVRSAQHTAIEAMLDAFAEGKQYFILEAGTGVGKSAVGLTVARALQHESCDAEKYGDGSYFLTTQKILQEQYVDDFGRPGAMKTIKSSANYTCVFHTKNTCAESLRALKVAEKGGNFWKKCVFDCVYKNAKKSFIGSPESVTNFPYFLAETQYAGKIKPRKVLVIDEAHNVPLALSQFIEIAITDRFAKSKLKLTMPQHATQAAAIKWITEVYAPKLSSYTKHVEKMLDKYEGLREKIQEFSNLAKQYELLDKHQCKINRFLEIYDKENWVFNLVPAQGRAGRRLEFKPIDVSHYAQDMLFRMGYKVVMMSATILDVDATCKMLGLKRGEVGFASIPSPFPIENRPVFTASIGKMSAKEIDTTLPNLAKAVEAILEQHPEEKGIIHCHTFKIANFLKKNIRNVRLLVHDSANREAVLQKHLGSKTPTVLLSPSMTEGVDLHGELGRFQIICKVPFPYLGDKLVRKRMNKWPWWYPLQTAKTIVQAVGRSVRSQEDHAVTYILDSDWNRFYGINKKLFPPGFNECLR